jgi:acyl-CoA synthetase (NDP forming)
MNRPYKGTLGLLAGRILGQRLHVCTLWIPAPRLHEDKLRGNDTSGLIVGSFQWRHTGCDRATALLPTPPCGRIVTAMQDLEYIFEPKSVAVVGATTNPTTVTNVTFLRQLLDFGYQGRIYPVNPHATEILGLKAYPSIRDIPEPVDYVVCAIAAPRTPKLMQECVAAKVKVVSMYTAGFSETGEEGARLERELVDIARKGGVRVLGPNCLGIHCPKAGLSLVGSISREGGHVGLLSQSGGNGQDMILGLAERRIYASKLVSFGNAADLNESDLLEYLGQDDDTRIIGIYIEGIKQPDRFARILRQVARAKPVIVLKGGKTPAGSGAVRLHTGALAGSSRVWDTLCHQAGILQVHDLKELIDTIQAFVYLNPPRGRRVGIIGIGGGANVLATDACETAGLTVPEFPPDVRAELRKFTPTAGTGLRNPVDTLGGVRGLLRAQQDGQRGSRLERRRCLAGVIPHASGGQAGHPVSERWH